MSNFNLEELFRGIQDAVIKANESMNAQHLELLHQFFDEENKPIMVSMTVPIVTEHGQMYQTIEVPKLTLVPITSMKVKEIGLDFKILMSSLTDDMLVMAEEELPEGNKTNSFKSFFKRNKKNLEVQIPQSSGKSNNYARIQIKMEASDPPEGVLKINGLLANKLP